MKKHEIVQEDQEDGMESYILNNILDDDDESTNGSSDSCTEIVSPNAVLSSQFQNEMYQVDQKKPAEAGWNCSACENYNFKNKTACNKCEKERTEED